MPIKIIRQDITRVVCDAIVNPTNRNLLPDGGTDAAIHSAAGPELFEYCQRLGGCLVGEAKITPAFNLPCKYVIHTAGPEWRGGLGGERVLLRSCYLESLKLAVENGCESVAFPLISSGTYGYPKESVLREAADIIGKFLEEYEMDVYIVVYDKTAYSISKELYDDVQTFVDNNYVEERFARFDTMYRKATDKERCKRGMLGGRREKSLQRARSQEDNSFASDFDDEYCLESDECIASAPDFEVGERIERLCAPQLEYSRRLSFDDSLSSNDIEELFENMDKGFAETLFYYIDKKGITDVEAYKRSNVGKKTFSKIKCNRNYKPSKITAVSFAIGLRLDPEETKHLLSTAGMCLSKSSKFDVIIEYFIITGNYKTIFDVNEVLYQFDQSLLGV